MKRVLIAVALVLGLAACSSPSTASSRSAGSSVPSRPGSPSVGTAGKVPTPDHVLVVVFENKAAGQVIGSAEAPYLSSLARSGADFTDAHGVTHPSQPNYLALFSGSTQGVSDDSCPRTFATPNLAEQLLYAGKTFTGYSEDLPSAGFAGCRANGYARRHNPWVDFPALPAEVNQPLSALPHDFAQLPTVAFVVPNLCSDMHDCPVGTGDRWAQAHLSGYVTWARDHDSLLVVTFDEDDGSKDNRIATFLVGPMVQATSSNQRIDHYSVLRTIEDMYGLSPVGESAKASPITGVWTTP